jgi:uncharacterized protein YjcR
MVDQYTGGFKYIIQLNYNSSAKEVLQNCTHEGLTYIDAAEKLGFGPGTIRKWARRFDLKLNPCEPTRLGAKEFIKFFSEVEINKHNILSVSWLHFDSVSLH